MTDVIQRDVLQLLGIRRWKRKAENMDECRRLMRETKDRKGVLCLIWMNGFSIIKIGNYS